MTDLLDRRQRRAAAILLCAVDLPAPALDLARHWTMAARVCPGITMDQLDVNEGRRHALEHARALIDDMLAEIPA